MILHFTRNNNCFCGTFVQMSTSDSKPESGETSSKPEIVIPEGKPKSGRVWKKKQTYRSSSQHRQGVLSHLCKSYDERRVIRDREKEMKAYERELRQQTNNKKEAERLRREQLVFRRLENENKAAVYQEIKPEKLKSLSKKQLRQIRKTSVNKNGQVELVSPWGPKK